MLLGDWWTNFLTNSTVGFRLNYAALTFTDSGNEGKRVTANGYHTMCQLQMDSIDAGGKCESSMRPNRRNSDDYAPSTHVQSMCTDMSYVSNSPTVVGTDGRKRNSSTSTCNGHYRGVYQYRDVRPITTTDLLCWCFQIARGMEYLSNRKVLHGDLAARNVLLASNNVVKICDFGLAREMYEEKYRKKTEVPLPIKWMALESIYYRVFSTQSDVWSFGVVMWELFTLGKNPYPGMEPDEQFYESLSQGYRMEKPNHAPSSIHDLMCECWDKEPSARPTFTAIADRIGDLMEEGLRRHYMDLNAPYLDLNQQRMEGREDLLKKMSGPDFLSVSKRATPDRSYANLTAPELPSTSGYLIPNSFHGNTLLVPPLESTGNYQNDPRLTSLANNAGYVFMNRGVEDEEKAFSPAPPHPLFPSTTNNNEKSEFENESKTHSPTLAISNINYVPNNIFESITNRPVTSPSHEEDSKRHKNDSGVSSIDSNFEGSLKRTPPPPNNNVSWNGGDFIDNSESGDGGIPSKWNHHHHPITSVVE